MRCLSQLSSRQRIARGYTIKCGIYRTVSDMGSGMIEHLGTSTISVVPHWCCTLSAEDYEYLHLEWDGHGMSMRFLTHLHRIAPYVISCLLSVPITLPHASALKGTGFTLEARPIISIYLG